MKKVSIFTAFILIATLTLFSCQNDEVQIEEQAADQELYPEITKKLQEMYFNTDGLEKNRFPIT